MFVHTSSIINLYRPFRSNGIVVYMKVMQIVYLVVYTIYICKKNIHSQIMTNNNSNNMSKRNMTGKNCNCNRNSIKQMLNRHVIKLCVHVCEKRNSSKNKYGSNNREGCTQQMNALRFGALNIVDALFICGCVCVCVCTMLVDFFSRFCICKFFRFVC